MTGECTVWRHGVTIVLNCEVKSGRFGGQHVVDARARKKLTRNAGKGTALQSAKLEGMVDMKSHLSSLPSDIERHDLKFSLLRWSGISSLCPFSPVLEWQWIFCATEWWNYTI